MSAPAILAPSPLIRHRSRSLVSVPTVIAHRGLSGDHPEHSLSAYRAAITAGADAVEVDVVPTADGVLVARHENELSCTTDVARHPEFAARRRTGLVDSRVVTGWFVEDFTLAELRELRLSERWPALRPMAADRAESERVATLAEVIDEVLAAPARLGREVRICIELKHPTHFADQGLRVGELLLAELTARRLLQASAPVSIFAFETGVLRWLAQRCGLELVQLLDAAHLAPYDQVVTGSGIRYGDLMTTEGLAWLDEWADGIGVRADLVLPVGRDGCRADPTPLVHDAHRLGLTVQVWTLRAENRFLPPSRWCGTLAGTRGDLAGDVADFLAAGVDGVITDHADLVRDVITTPGL